MGQTKAGPKQQRWEWDEPCRRGGSSRSLGATHRTTCVVAIDGHPMGRGPSDIPSIISAQNIVRLCFSAQLGLASVRTALRWFSYQIRIRLVLPFEFGFPYMPSTADYIYDDRLDRRRIH